MRLHIANFWFFCALVATASAAKQAVRPAEMAAVERAIESGRREIYANPLEALKQASVAESLSARLASPQKQETAARIAWLRATALVGSNRAPEAITIIRKALTARPPLTQDPENLAELYMALATAHSLLGQTEAALYELQRAYRLYHAAHAVKGEAKALLNIGSMYYLARDFDQALRYYSQSASIDSSDKLVRLVLLNNQGNALKALGKAIAAERAYAESAGLARQTKSVAFEARTMANLATAQLMANNIDAAERSIQRGSDLAPLLPANANPALDAVAAQVALRRGKTELAVSRIEKAFVGARGTTSKVMLRDFEQIAYEIYKARGDEMLALKHLERFKQLDDQARALAASARAALVSAQFDFANQNARIAQLRQNEAEQEARIQRNQVVFQRRLLGAALAIVLLLLVGFLSIRRSRNQVRAANNDLTGANADLERALAARTEFLATTSHEIRTPLNGILGMTQVLLADRRLDAEVKGKIELVHGAGETMKALVDDILDVSKIANGELVIHPAEMNLGKLLREAAQVWEAQATTKGVAISTDFADVPERIVEDEVRLRQIVFNLMANAVKFTDRGEVTLAAAFQPDAPDADCAGGMLRIEIRDTGIGIPADRLEDVFESFRQVDGGTTRRHGGTGLGLAICRNLARAMGGDVSVTSVLGVGSTFLVELPCERIVRKAPGARAASLDRARLLLVDANPLARSILSAVLAPVVATLVSAGDLDEALTTLAEEDVDLVLADAGAVAADMRIAARLADAAGSAGAAMVLLWPTPDHAVISDADRAGILHIVAKPIAAHEVVAALRDIYMARRSPEEIAA